MVSHYERKMKAQDIIRKMKKAGSIDEEIAFYIMNNFGYSQRWVQSYIDLYNFYGIEKPVVKEEQEAPQKPVDKIEDLRPLSLNTRGIFRRGKTKEVTKEIKEKPTEPKTVVLTDEEKRILSM